MKDAPILILDELLGNTMSGKYGAIPEDRALNAGNGTTKQSRKSALIAFAVGIVMLAVGVGIGWYTRHIKDEKLAQQVPLDAAEIRQQIFDNIRAENIEENLR